MFICIFNNILQGYRILPIRSGVLDLSLQNKSEMPPLRLISTIIPLKNMDRKAC